MRFVVKISLVVFIGLLAGNGLRAETLDRIVAVVNNDIILYSEVEEQAKMLQKLKPGINLDDPTQRAQIEREILAGMIREKLADQEIKRLKINVKESEVDAAVETFKKENGFTDEQLKYVLQQEGKSIEDFRKQLKAQLERSRLIERVLKSKTVITEDQIDAYLQTQQPLAGSNERRHLAVIFLPFSESSHPEEVEKLAKEIHSRLKNGGDFAKLARQYSRGPAVEDGGDIGFISVNELAPAIEQATRGLKPDEITEPMKTPQGYYIIKVIEIQREQQSVSNSSARERARAVLFQQEVNRKFEEWVKELEEKSFIQINL